MMSLKKFIPFLIIFSIGIFIQDLRAQNLNIKGDTIFVNAEAEIQVNFPTSPTSFSIAPKDAAYTLKGLGTGVNISAKFENTKPATLFVSEGKRTHNFVIVFKKDIDYNTESFFDYSTIKKLEEHIRETANRKSREPEKKPAATEENEITARVAAKAEVPAAQQDNTSNYYALLEQGDKDLQQKNYPQATSNFEKAHALRPGDRIPIQRLEEIKAKLAENDTATAHADYMKYVTITGNAKFNLDQKKYTEAQRLYKQALDLRPGDLYASHQLEIIDKFLKQENGQIEQQKLKDAYNGYISQGDKAFNKNELAEARIAYEQALTIRQNDSYATGRLKLTDDRERRQRESEDLENNYTAAIQSADKFFKAGDYANAKADYNKALAFVKRPWPQDQLKKINKIVADQLVQEDVEKQKLAQRLNAERLEKERQALEIKYESAIQSGDKFFKAGDYENAKIDYNKALDFIKKDWPKEQIDRINKLVADQIAKENLEKQERQKQQLEDKYTTAMQSADKFFQAADYTNAKIEYNKAMSIIPKALPQEQIKKINKIIADQLAQANAEKQRQAMEAEITLRFNTLIKSAEAEFDKSNYLKAKKLYSEAYNLKPSEDQPKERLLIIDNILTKIAADLKAKNDSITQAEEVNRKYNIALLKAKSNYRNNDLPNAKIFYEEAVSLKPFEEEPKKQLKSITNQLAEIARVDEINATYDRKIVLADSLVIAKAYESAITAYNESLSIKPSEGYPKSQLKYIQSELAGIARRNEIKKRDDDEQRYKEALTLANKAVADKRFNDAKSAYSTALSIHSDNEYAKKRLEIISYQIEKAAAEKTIRDSLYRDSVAVADAKSKKGKRNKIPVTAARIVTVQEPAKPAGDTLVFQAKPITYTDEELKRKYPNIDFAALPPEQPFNKSAVDSKENLHIYDIMLVEKPRLTLSSLDQKTKLICQGVNFEGTKAYFKFLIQNFSNTDFLTGAMMLTWTRKQGNRVKLYPIYLFPAYLPLIKPLNEAVVIYVCKTYEISDDETLKFELSDRFNKIKLQLNIPGSTYNEEWVRY